MEETTASEEKVTVSHNDYSYCNAIMTCCRRKTREMRRKEKRNKMTKLTSRKRKLSLKRVQW